MNTPAPGRRSPWTWLTASFPTILLLAVSGRYGFHRDELYFLAAGRRIDWGYVDQPPLVPMVARVSELALGVSPVALRVLPAVAVGLTALLAGSIAARLGGGRKAQLFATATVGFCGVLLGEGHLLSTAVFDFALWGVGLWIVIRLVDGADRRWWLGLGLVVGIGMQNKHTMAFFAASILVAFLVTSDRRHLRDWHPWAGALISLIIAAPNLMWQSERGWPQLEVAAALRERSDGLAAFVFLQPALLSVTLAIPAFAGLWWLWRSRWRVVAIAYLVLFVVFAVTGGKAYYLAPMYTALLAGGALWFERLTAGWQKGVAALAAAGAAFGLFIALPLLPPAGSSTLDLTGELAETIGWPELMTTVVDARDQIPAAERDETIVFTGSYGEAGAIEILGAGRGLTVASGHNNYWLWGPPARHGPIIAIGHVEEVLNLVCPSATRIGLVSNSHGIPNELHGKPIWLCSSPTRQLADVWDRARHYN